MIQLQRLIICLCAFLLLGAYSLSAQNVEICDNAVDDDGDGLIDLNDRDCNCPIVEPISLIPNASFEEQECCPSGRSQMSCAVDWIQASGPTTDYIHMCGWRGWDNLPLPLPIPDGDGCVGYRNGRFGSNGTNANWKEYAGACLSSPLKADVSYKFQFYIGFTNSINSPPTDVTFYGASSCDDLPFGDGDVEFGCPTNGPGWEKLGDVYVRGTNQWKAAEIIVTPDKDYAAMAIGPSCSHINGTTDIYYFFDNLILADEESFAFEITLIGGVCDDEVALQVPRRDSLSYQWYKDGIALVGESEALLTKIYGDGDYQVKIQSPDIGCRITGIYTYEKPQPVYEEIITICEGESFFFDGIYQETTGIYIDSLKTAEGCDSVSILHLEVFENTGDSIEVKIFRTEYYNLGTGRYYSPGIYTEVLRSSVGCDSTVVVDLSYYDIFLPNAFSPNGDGINDVFSIAGSEEIISIKNMKIFNRWGNLVYEGAGLSPHDLTSGWDGTTNKGFASEGVYVFVVNILFDDGKERLSTGSVTLLR